MITFEILGGVRVYGLSRLLRNKVYLDLTFENQKYKNALKHGGWVSPSVMPNLYFFSVNKEEKYIYIPRGYFYFLHKAIHNMGLEHKIIDKTLLLDKLDLEFLGTPRDYQQEAVNDMIKYPNGILQGSTGCGKTFMGIHMIQKRNQPTLVIVHSKELLIQWKDSIKQFLGIDAGLIGGGKFDIQPVTVGIINSVKNKAEELRDRFGHIILDEVHRSPSTMWTETLGRFPARYYLGLSATVFRNDGLGKAINVFVGPTKHKVDKERLHETGAVLKPEIQRIYTRFSTEARTEYSSVISQMAYDEERNNLIVGAIMHDLRLNDAPVLVVSDRVAHCEILAKKLTEERELNCSLLMSKMSKTDRLKSVQDIRDGASKILIATVALIGEGFDAPNLHSLFLTTPIKFKGRIIQTIGRILRPEEGKTARVYDFRDDFIWMLKASGKKRDAIYKEHWG